MTKRKFRVGDRVRVVWVARYVNMNGTVTSDDGAVFHPYWVEFDDGKTLCFSAHELELIGEPAPTPESERIDTIVIEGTYMAMGDGVSFGDEYLRSLIDSLEVGADYRITIERLPKRSTSNEEGNA